MSPISTEAASVSFISKSESGPLPVIVEVIVCIDPLNIIFDIV
jgi:hypothetical protein